MSVLVKGMEMPKCCLHCDFANEFGDCCCKISNPHECEFDRSDRPDWCPLVEVPTPHGRLIDADEFHQQAGLTDYNEMYMDLDEFKAFPTVIEAEEGK